MNSLRVRLTALAVVAVMVFGVAPSRAEVIVYDLSVANILTNVNFTFVEGGYLVLDPVAGTFSTALVIMNPDTLIPFYSTSVLSGTYSTLLSESNGNEYAVLLGSSTSSGADSLSFQLVGALSSGVGVGGGISADVARQMRGILMANAAESSTGDASTTGSGISSDTATTTFTFGFAGQSRVRADFNRGITRDVNNNGLDAAGALALVSQRLENRGVAPEASASPSPSPVPSPSPSP